MPPLHTLRALHDAESAGAGAAAAARARRSLRDDVFAVRRPARLQEREQRALYAPAPGTGALSGPPSDKVYSVAWLEGEAAGGKDGGRGGCDALLLGTKDNQLLRCSLSAAGRALVVAVPLPERDGGSVASASAALPPPPADAAPASPPRPFRETGGVHAVEVSPCGLVVACGGADARDVALLALPSLSPLRLLPGGDDVVFDLCFAAGGALVAVASRDSTLSLWDAARGALLSRRLAHDHRCRSCALVGGGGGGGGGAVASVGGDAWLRLWDPCRGLAPCARLSLPHPAEVTCVAADRRGERALHRSLAAVGSAHWADVVDTRAPGGGAGGGRGVPLRAPPGATGVRSLSLLGHLVTVGCGGAVLSFFDLRSPSAPLPGPARPPGRGAWHGAPPGGGGGDWLGGEVGGSPGDGGGGGDLGSRHAILAHAWDSGGTRLAAAGGPLLASERGVYAALWE